jgi:uncharacterized membrane protein
MADISEVKEDQIKDIFQSLEQLSGKLLRPQFLIDTDNHL